MSFQQISAGKAILILHSKCFFGKSILGGCQFIARFASFLAITNHFYLMIISKLSHLLGARNFTQLAGVPLFGTYSDSNPRLKLSQDLIWEIVSFLGKYTLEVVLFSFFFSLVSVYIQVQDAVLENPAVGEVWIITFYP